VKGISIIVTFPDDGATKLAARFNRIRRDYDVAINAKDVPDMVAQIEKAVSRMQRKIRSIDIAGHGSPGSAVGRIDTDVLQNENDPTTMALGRLRELWADDNAGMTLRVCNTARYDEGKEFLGCLAKTINAKVIAWDDFYEVIPMGKEYTATPDGKVTQSGDTGRTSIWFRRILGRKD